MRSLTDVRAAAVFFFLVAASRPAFALSPEELVSGETILIARIDMAKLRASGVIPALRSRLDLSGRSPENILAAQCLESRPEAVYLFAASLKSYAVMLFNTGSKSLLETAISEYEAAVKKDLSKLPAGRFRYSLYSGPDSGRRAFNSWVMLPDGTVIFASDGGTLRAILEGQEGWKRYLSRFRRPALPAALAESAVSVYVPEYPALLREAGREIGIDGLSFLSGPDGIESMLVKVAPASDSARIIINFPGRPVPAAKTAFLAELIKRKLNAEHRTHSIRAERNGLYVEIKGLHLAGLKK